MNGHTYNNIFYALEISHQTKTSAKDKSSDENNISMEKPPVLTILTGLCKMLIGLQNMVRVS